MAIKNPGDIPLPLRKINCKIFRKRARKVLRKEIERWKKVERRREREREKERDIFFFFFYII